MKEDSTGLEGLDHQCASPVNLETNPIVKLLYSRSISGVLV